VIFAMLSAREPFDKAAAALAALPRHLYDYPEDPNVIEAWAKPRFSAAGLSLANAKAHRLGQLVEFLRCTPTAFWERHQGETWHDCRLRFAQCVPGLGLAKASFAVCLLYPLHSEVCCLDTWMLKLLSSTRRPVDDPDTYFTLEEEIRAMGKAFHVGAFVAQWATWDCLRGKGENHAFLM